MTKTEGDENKKTHLNSQVTIFKTKNVSMAMFANLSCLGTFSMQKRKKQKVKLNVNISKNIK